MKTRYTVIDHENNVKYTYSEWQWKLAFILIFIAGFGAGVLLYFICGN